MHNTFWLIFILEFNYLCASRVRDLFLNRGFSRFAVHHQYQHLNNKNSLANALPRRNCMLARFTQKQRYIVNSMQSLTFRTRHFVSLTPRDPRRPASKRSLAERTVIHTLFNIPSPPFDFCLTFFWQLALPCCATIYDRRYFYFHSARSLFAFESKLSGLWGFVCSWKNLYFIVLLAHVHGESTCKRHIPISTTKQRETVEHAELENW